MAAARQQRPTSRCSGAAHAVHSAVLLVVAMVVAHGPAVHARAGLPCQVSKTTYHSSPLELSTQAQAEAWQNAYCAQYVTDGAARTELLRSIDSANGLHHSRLTPEADVPPGLSYYEHTVICRDHSYSVRTVIEPLYASLRHPDAITCPNDQSPVSPGSLSNLMSVAHIIMADSASPVATHARRRLYFDLGASLWPELSQSWMIGQYKARGIVFDRVLLWEAISHPGTKIFEKVPPEMFHAYQYFNEPLTADPDSPKNPLNILRKIAHPSDFVALKLDIDSTPLEVALVKQILGDPSLSSRIDELFWEPHFNFPPLAACCWGVQDMSLAEAWGLMHSMRGRGIRVHGWP